MTDQLLHATLAGLALDLAPDSEGCGYRAGGACRDGVGAGFGEFVRGEDHEDFGWYAWSHNRIRDCSWA